MNSAAQHVPEQGMSPGPTKGENGGAVGSRSFSIEVGEGKHKLNVEKCSPTNPSESTKLPAASLMGQVFKNRTEKIPEGSEPVPAVLRSFSYTTNTPRFIGEHSAHVLSVLLRPESSTTNAQL